MTQNTEFYFSSSTHFFSIIFLLTENHPFFFLREASWSCFLLATKVKSNEYFEVSYIGFKLYRSNKLMSTMDLLSLTYCLGPASDTKNGFAS